ncbi:1,4-beta-xylanase [Chimaeribacter arupi]|uniref:1,4-beta-xylanase n=1 Tax=Chimaeribacter arupi TaxID=2060066 RepID=UPI00271215AD|nr:1,4-beta-xylanase [Chimaeribacter arupi]WKZ92049.1 1,4-beta-xylanase [Chimaeribacter arupi]
MYTQWPTEQAQAWHRQQRWGCGFNYLPRTAVNWLEMWQEETFDPATIEQELRWAGRYGYTRLRTNLPFTVWQHDRAGLLARIDRFLAVADACGFQVMLSLLDDCAFSGDEPVIGPQKAPRPGVHNSQAAGSPGRAVVLNPGLWPQIETYVREVVGRFRDDPRIGVWDLYNEPGNSGIFCGVGQYAEYDNRLDIYALSLMIQVFRWARQADPCQPLTVAAWHIPDRHACGQAFRHPIDIAALHLSDVVSYHAYVDTPGQVAILARLAAFQRPVLCTEWLARHVGSVMAEQLPLFRAQGVACYQWGLVQGKTQTWLPWPGIAPDDATAALWFHDVLTPDGLPFSEQEMALVARLSQL